MSSAIISIFTKLRLKGSKTNPCLLIVLDSPQNVRDECNVMQRERLRNGNAHSWVPFQSGFTFSHSDWVVAFERDSVVGLVLER